MKELKEDSKCIGPKWKIYKASYQYHNIMQQFMLLEYAKIRRNLVSYDVEQHLTYFMIPQAN